MPNADEFDLLWFNANLATMHNGQYNLITNGAVGVRDGLIAWVGAADELDRQQLMESPHAADCEGQLVTPGLIDCHTHLIYGGSRAREFELRLKHTDYTEIAQAGGGIISTVRATRRASEDELYASALTRLNSLQAEGVTTVEIKSGYGLNLEDELKMLRVAALLESHNPVRVLRTFLGAHALPPEFSQHDDYIDFICDTVLPRVANDNLAHAVDAFCEGIAFSPQQVARVFDAAMDHSLPIKLHAEQLSDSKGAVMAARRNALSVDHLEYLQADDVAALADHGSVAVLLPGAFYFLRETKLPPIGALRSGGVPMAIATDSNPGSSPIESPLLIMNMACTLFRLTPEEALAGMTVYAAQALGLENETGSIETGKRADLVRWSLTDPVELIYRVGARPGCRIMFGGAVV